MSEIEPERVKLFDNVGCNLTAGAKLERKVSFIDGDAHHRTRYIARSAREKQTVTRRGPGGPWLSAKENTHTKKCNGAVNGDPLKGARGV